MSEACCTHGKEMRYIKYLVMKPLVDTEVWVRTHVIPCGICCGRNGSVNHEGELVNRSQMETRQM
jgi:hypothetical protein